jgi:DNA-binding transcriptional regulator GbsR (MarR family)
MSLSKETMPETMYRASRCCRIVGNPTAYLILRCLDKSRKTPSELSAELKVPISTISMTLRHLRQVELVRYATRGHKKLYWVKEKRFLGILDSLEQWVERMRTKRS